MGIEQEVERVDHGMALERLTSIGYDVECVTRMRVVKWHVEYRTVLNRTNTVVIR